VPDETIDPPPPTIEVLSDMYSCTIPNGVLRATVAGNDADFNFDWYNGSTSTGSPDYNGSVYANLDIGEYTSTATDKETGCLSEPASARISDTRTYPDFEVVTENSLCIQPTGKAYLDFENFINYNSIEWNVDGQTVFGPAAFELWPGDHEVTVYGLGDCPTTETFSVGTDIYVYNGVSPNGDGLNEVFTIGCIDMFIGNNVRIYNRSGQLVFEMDDYDNDEHAFDGIGNRGIYLDSRDVPDGTYFYVINKKDGSKPVSGYLEVMR
jgi:gliding motility-associated-like protein